MHGAFGSRTSESHIEANLERLCARLNNPHFLHHDGEIVTYTDGKPDELNTVQSKVMTVAGEFDFKYHTFDHVQDPAAPFEVRHGRIEAGDIVQNFPLHDLASLMEFEETLVAEGLSLIHI